MITTRLKEIRISKSITQKEASAYLGVSLRSYKDYENDSNKESSIKYKYMVEKLFLLNQIDEEHGVLKLEDIIKTVKMVFDKEKYLINFCYLFGSYAKGYASDTSDVDLIIDSEITGLNYFGLVEDLRESLHKKVDLLKLNQLDNNQELLREVMKDGIKIYG